jgi:hypothetical protein
MNHVSKGGKGKGSNYKHYGKGKGGQGHGKNYHQEYNDGPAPTPSPTASSHYHTFPDGSLSCFPQDSDNHATDSSSKTIVEFEYSLETENGYDEQQVIDDIEMEITKLFGDIIQCDMIRGSSSHDRVLVEHFPSRQLAIIGVEAAPKDEITGKGNKCEKKTVCECKYL